MIPLARKLVTTYKMKLKTQRSPSMLNEAKTLKGYELNGLDGEIG